MRTSRVGNCLLRSVAIVAAASAATLGSARAASNVTPANVDVLNLLSPFLNLNASAVGQTTLADNLAVAIGVNNLATPALQALSISDENLLSAASNSLAAYPGGTRVVYGTNYGVAANLGGVIPNGPTITSSNGMQITPSQSDGGLGTVLGAIYVQGVNAYAAGTTSVLPNTVALLTSAYSFTSPSLGVAKFYFANGTINGSTAAVPPTGLTLPTANGLPGPTSSVYNIAYGVSNSTPGQNPYGDSRPFQVSPSNIVLYDPSVANSASSNNLLSNPAFPSGHTNYAFTDSYLLGMLVPQQFQSMLSRAAQYGNSRIVLGAHYPLDVIASRAWSAEQLAQGFTNPAYIGNAATTGAAINLPSLFSAAQPELTSYLNAQLNTPQFAGCGATVAACAASSANANGLSPSPANASVYAYELTYGLPTLSFSQAPREQAPAGGPDASILLATLYGGSSSAALLIAPNGGIDGKLATRTINQIIVNTEGQALSAFYGTSLSYWAQINLYAAAGYFQGVTGTLNTANGDEVKTDATVASGGVVNVTGLFKVDGNFRVAAGGALGVTLDGLTPVTDYSQVEVGKAADLEGALDVMLGNGFALGGAETFDLVTTLGGLTDDVSSLVFDGAACSALGGSRYSCADGGRNDVISLLVTGGGDDLTLRVDAVPEPATWAMMLIAGFAGLGLAGWRRATPRSLA